MTPFTAPSPARAFAGAPVLVLGAAGFLGRWVARAMSIQGARLTLVDRSRGALESVLSEWEARGEMVEADVTDAAALREVIERAHPTTVFNLAGYGISASERDEAIAGRINAELPAVLCDAVADAADSNGGVPARLVHMGSAYEYGAIGGDLAEDSEPNPVTLYGRTKLDGTRRLTARCQARGVRGVTARLFMAYGPGEHAGRLFPSLLEAARTGATLDLTDGTQRRDFVWIEDVVQGLQRLALADAPPGAVVNLASGRLTTVRAFAETAADILDLPLERLRFGALPTRPEEMAHDEVNVERLRGLTGWVPATSVDNGISRAVAFLRRTAGRSM